MEPARNLEPAEVADRRLSRRVRVTCEAVLETLTGDFSGQLWDISEGGARLQLAAPPQVGLTARLRWAEHEALCHVIWSDGEMCGVAFDRPLPAAVVTGTAELNRVIELPIARVGNIAAGRKRARPVSPVISVPAEAPVGDIERASPGWVIELPRIVGQQSGGGHKAMSAAQQMFLHGAPLSHIVAFEARAAVADR